MLAKFGLFIVLIFSLPALAGWGDWFTINPGPRPTPTMAPIPPAVPGGPTNPVARGSAVLLMDGVNLGALKSSAGGSAWSEVINEPSNTSSFVKKHIAQPRFEDISLDVGFGMSPSFFDWISSNLQKNYQRKNGAIAICDFKGNIYSENQFSEALFTEFGVPTLEAASKEQGYFKVKFAVESTRNQDATGKCATTSSPNKAWLISGFRLELNGLETSNVTRIEGFTIRQKISEVNDGHSMVKEPIGLEFPNLEVTLLESSSKAWAEWHRDFVLNGNSSEQAEKSGALVFLAQDGRELGRLKLYNVGIFKFGSVTNSGDAAPRVAAGLYVERMTLDVPKN